MAIRTTGLQSGLDVESIVKELMSAQSLKKTKVENQKTKLEWKQEKWSALNTKLYALYTEQVSKMRLQSSFSVKKTSSSDETKASVTASASATNGSYSLSIQQVATSQYVTGAQLDDSAITDGIKTTTKLSDIDSSLVGKELLVKTGDKTTGIQIKEDTTIADFTKMLGNAGLNASYDTTQKRFFISSKASGAENAFDISTVSLTGEEISSRQAIEDYVDFSKLSDASKKIVTDAYQTFQTETVGSEKYNKALQAVNDVAYTQKKANTNAAATLVLKAQLYDENIEEVTKDAKASMYDTDEDGNETLKEAFTQKYGDAYDKLTDEKRAETGMTKEEYIADQAQKTLDKAVDSAITSKVNSLISSDADTKTRLAAMEKAGVDSLDGISEAAVTKFAAATYEGTDSYSSDSVKAGLEPLIEAYANVGSRSLATDGTALNALGLADVSVATDGTVSVAGGANASTNAGMPNGMAVIGAQDSIATLNGATLTSSSSLLAVNGLSITLNAVTTSPITFNVTNDTDGIYKNIKSFLTQYNTVMKEMYDSYNAASAKGYDPLTDDEKEAMTDDQIKLWEDKIKNSLLKSDTTLNSVMTAMRSAMSSSVEVDGKSYSLSYYGIMTSTDYTEGGQLHIYGDVDDATYATQTDKLKKAIEDDPETIMQVFTGITQNLYTAMKDKMATSTISSALTFYNDKQIKSDLKEYGDQISDWTDRLADMEDDYYDKFTAMETAMAKLNSQTSQLSALLG